MVLVNCDDPICVRRKFTDSQVLEGVIAGTTGAFQ